MRHNVTHTGLRQSKGKYKANMKNLITQLFKHGAIKTTQSKASKMQPVVEKIITRIKGKKDHEAIRYLSYYITEKEVSKKIMADKGNYTAKSGHTAIYKLGQRGGDAAPIVQIQLNVK